MGGKDKKVKMLAGLLLVMAAPGLIMGILSVVLLSKIAAGALAAGAAKAMILAVMAVVIVACIVGASLLENQISRLVGSVGELANGELDTRANKLASRDDAIGKDLRAIGNMMGKLAKIVSGIHTATDSLDSMSDEFKDSFEHMSGEAEQVSEAVGQIMDNTESQSVKTADIEDKIAAISRAVDVITENVTALTASADSMKECNEVSKGIMGELIQISTENIASIENVRTQADLTNQSAMEIRQATEIISGIASQTNLLALNASIEAARAGENGKGFAVVAEEIRALADQSKEASGHITTIVNELLENSSDSVAITQKVSEASARQNEKIHETEEVFHQMNEESLNVSNSIVEIHNEVQDLDRHKDIIGEAIVILSDAAAQNTASAEKTVAAMNELEDMVKHCRESTDQITDITKELVGYIGEVHTVSQKGVDFLKQDEA